MNIDPIAGALLFGIGAMCLLIIVLGLFPLFGVVEGAGIGLALIGLIMSLCGAVGVWWVVNEVRKHLSGEIS